MHSDHYDTKTAAKRAAKRMGLDGCHRMSCNGDTVYMPGESHADYMDFKEGGMMGGGSPVDEDAFGF
jgi:hypothetical protein